MRVQVEDLQTQIAGLTNNLSSLSNTVTDTRQPSFAEIVNILDNSFPEWSKDAYTTLGVTPATAGDGNLECYNWYRELVATTDITPSSARALKAPKTIEPAEHSLFVANEGANADIPRWDKVNGWISMGGTAERWDLYAPLPNDIALPGQRFYFQFEARLASGDLPSGLQAYAGIWDNTAGQRKYIEGGSFTITGSIFGTPGATNVNYKVLARTDSGEEALSNTLNFPNAPAVFSQLNHPRIDFSGVAGFTEFEIYRQIGTQFVLQFTVTNAIEGTYFDVGNPPQAVVSGFPTITTTKPLAYAVTTTFAPGSINGSNFVRQTLTIQLPTTYDRSVTGPGQQYIRFGFTAFAASAGQLQVRKLGLSLGHGNWSRSANDTRTGVHSSPSTSTTGLPAGSGGGGVEPDPPEPGGGGWCTTLDTPQRVYDEDGWIIEMPLGELRSECRKRKIYADSDGVVGGLIRSVKTQYASEIRHVRTEKGYCRPFTPGHPLVTGPTDITGTPLSALKVGSVIYTKALGDIVSTPDRIVEITPEYGQFQVGIAVQDGSHICVLGEFVSHNEKPVE